ncbi:MAG: DUF1015 family protein [Lentisphaeria bacterium]
MANVAPFAAYISEGATAPIVATLPYDVMNRKEAAAMAKKNPDSFLHITRSEIDLPDSTDAYAPEVYNKARENWLKLSQSVLHKDTTPGYYVYSLVMNGKRQTGIVAAASVEDYNNNIIRKHERTRKEKEDDRTRHISTLRAQTGAVFLTYRDSNAINSIVADTMKTAPAFDFTAEDGIQHTGWRVPAEKTAELKKAFEDVPLLYIADGHHRAASASRTQAYLAQKNNVGEADTFLSVIFPAGQLHILAYNRVLFNLNGLTAEAFLSKVRQACTLTPEAPPIPDTPGTVSMFFDKKWWKLQLRTNANANAIEQLDVSMLQNQILQPILGIDDPRTDKNIDFVGGIRGTIELEKRVLSGECSVAFSMVPTTVEQLMDIADKNAIMPPKSTWFEPKLRDGLFVHEI